MRLPAFWALSACLAVAGCSSFGKKSPSSPPPDPPSAGPRQPFWAEPGSRPGPVVPAPASGAATAGGPGRVFGDPNVSPANLNAETSGVLAGSIIDVYDRRPANAFIQVALAENAGTPGGKPIEVEANSQGYFLIQGLQPGKTYQLTARVKDGSRVLAGAAQARPPYTRLVIRLSEENAGGAAPLPPHAATVGPYGGNGPPTSLPPGVAPPPEAVPGTGAVAPPTGNIARDPTNRPAPTATVPGPPANPGPPRPPLMPAPSKSAPLSYQEGIRPGEFRLTTLEGKPWDFSQHYGRLVLVDFWGTWCLPCVASIPQVKKFQQFYGADGLEVIGVACRERGPWAQQVEGVAQVQRKLAPNYQFYLDYSDHNPGPAQARFGVTQFPTLILLDGDGRELWRGNAGQDQELEQVIASRLGTPLRIPRRP
jgi:thiol-disulfide isomerase/thioredoxin